MKRILSLLLAVCMIMGMIPIGTSAEAYDDGAVYVADGAEFTVTDETEPTVEETEAPTEEPTEAPTEERTEIPTEFPTEEPTVEATEAPVEDKSLPKGGTSEEVSSLQGQIDALPTVEEFEALSVEEQDAIYETAQAISDAYEALSEEAQAQVDITRLEDLFAFINGQTNATGITNQSQLQAALQAGGTVKLTQDITITSSIKLRSTTVTLDLNGYTIYGRMTKNCNIIEDYPQTEVNITLTDTGSPQTGAIDGGGSSGYRGRAFGLVGASTLTMNGGTIRNCISYDGHSGAGCVNTFIMNGGLITNCSASSYGGGVTVVNAATINGGTISNCTTGENGGGINSLGTITMTGGTISSCSASQYGGGVYVYPGASFTLDGGSILDCTAGICGDSIDNRGTFTYNSGTVNTTVHQHSGTLSGTNIYTVTFDSNGGTEVESRTYFGAGNKATKPTYPTHSTKSYYHFDGWYLGDELYDFDTVVTGDITLKAKWDCVVTSESELTDALTNKESCITVGADFNVTSGHTVSYTTTLDLNGYVLTRTGSGRFFTVSGNLTLTDSNKTATHTDNTLPTGGVLTGGKAAQGGGVFVAADGVFTMKAGTIYACQATETGWSGCGGGVYSVGTFTMTGGEISGCYSANHAGGVGCWGGTFTLDGGTITQCSSYDTGAGVHHDVDGIFYFKSGTISYCTSSDWGGGIRSYKGKFEMSGGLIEHCSGKEGGGIYISHYAEASMTGGTIRDCTAPYGGGVCVIGPTVSMKNVTIDNCTSSKNGGGIYNSGILTMDNCTVSNCESQNNCSGGGIANLGTLTMTDSVIRDCTSSASGGAVYNNSTFTMNGGTISGCDSVKFGGGISNYTSGTFTMNGGEIYNCRTDGHGGGICNQGTFKLTDGNVYNCTAATNPLICDHTGTADITLYTVTFDSNGGTAVASQQFMGEGNKATKPADPTHSTKSWYHFKGWYLGDELYDFDKPLTGSITLTAAWECVVYNESELTTALADANATRIRMGCDFPITKSATVSRKVTLDLDGRILTQTAKTCVITVSSGGDLILVDTSSDREHPEYDFGENEPITGGIITGGRVTGAWGAGIRSYGNLTMNGGTIYDCSISPGNYGGGGIGCYCGTFTMNGGTITRCSADWGGGIYAENGAKFYIYGGTISNCSAIYNGGGIGNAWGYVEMYGGTIVGCTAKNGAGVLIYGGGTYKFIGGEIKDCVASQYGGGVYNQNSTYIMTGGTISDCKSGGCGNAVYNSGTFYMSGGEISSNNVCNYNGILCNFGTFYHTDGIVRGKIHSKNDVIYPETNDEGTKIYSIDLKDRDSLYATIRVAENGKATEPVAPVKGDHIFLGWYTDGGEKWDFDRDTVTSNLTLTAQWKKLITTEPELRRAIEDGETDIVLGGDIELTGGLDIPDDLTIDLNGGTLSCGGYVHGGGLTIKDTGGNGTISGIFEGGISGTLAGDHCIVTFKDGDNVISKQTIVNLDGTKLIKPDYDRGSDYIFVGWYTTDGEKWNFDTTVSAKNDDFTLYAKWTRVASTPDDINDTIASGGGSIKIDTDIEDGGETEITVNVGEKTPGTVTGPVFTGIVDGGVYEGERGFTVSGEGTAVTVNGVPLTPDPDGTYTLKPSDGPLVVKATGVDGGVSEITVRVGGHGQTHPLTHVPAVPATKETQGNIEYWYCAKCDKYFADAAGTKEISKADTITAKLTETPQTGDSTDLLLWFTLLTLCGAAMVYSELYAKKRKMK